MKRKVTDILSPQKIEKERKREREIKLEVEEKESPPRLKTFAVQAPTPSFKKGLIFSLFFLILSGLGVFCYLTLSKAEIEIWPETAALNLDTKLIIDKEAKEPNFLAKVIPAEVLQKERTITETFPTSGKVLKEEKADGIIKVYNAYSTSPQALVATTRFVSADGKVFRTPVKVTLPGGRYERGKFILGEIDIKVIGDQPGPEYNIGPSTFSIPGFAGTDKYTKFYAKSFQSMAGGLREEVAKATKEDLTQAEDSLVRKAKEECKDLLKNELQSEVISSEFNYLKDNIRTEIIERFSLATAGEELKEFKFQVKVKCETLLFKKEDFENFAKEIASSQVAQGKKLYEKSLTTEYSAETVNFDSGKITLSVEVSAKIYSDINIFDFKNALRGKSLLESKIFLESQPKITKANIKLWPFWVRRVPEEINKIKFNLIIDTVSNTQ